MAGLFAKAAAKKQETPKDTKKATTWLVSGEEQVQIAKSVSELVHLEAEKKAIDAKMNIHKTQVKTYAEKLFLRDYAQAGVMPPTPLVVLNPEGQKVNLVVQDRSGQYKVKDEQQEALAELLGVDAARDLLYEETSISFSREVMALPGVSEAVEKALEKVIGKLVSEETLPQEVAEGLIEVDVKTSFKPKTLEKLGLICGRDTGTMKQFLDIAGSSITRFIKS